MTITSSSTQTYPSSSASTLNNLQESMTAASLPQQPYNNSEDNYYWLKEWIIPVMGMILTAVIAYFSSFIAVKDDISTNKNDISLLKNDFSHIENSLKDLKSDFAKSENSNIDIMVLKSKIQDIEFNLRNHNHKNTK